MGLSTEIPSTRVLLRPPTPPSVPALLSEANLLRIRSEYEEAENRCVDVIRSNPKNADAHSLLGDILREQGRLTDALQWYQLALDIDSSRTADKQRVKQLTDIKRRNLAAAQSDLKAPGISTEFGTQNLLGVSPTNWFRAIWVLFTVFAVAVVILVVWLKQNKHTVEFLDANGAKPQNPTIVSPPSNHVNNANENPITKTVQSKSNPDRNAEQTSVNPSPPSAPLGFGQSTSRPNSDRELSILNFLVTKGNFLQGTIVADTRLNLETGHTIVILIQKTDIQDDTASVKNGILRDAAEASVNLFGCDPGVISATIEVRRPSPDGKMELVFMGDIDRSNFPPNNLNVAHVVYSRLWWSQGFQSDQPSGIAGDR